MNFPKVILTAAVFGGVSMASYGTANAALLATDPAAMAAFRGAQPFTAVLGPLSFAATVEYAVYAPGTFNGSAVLGAPADPSGGTDYVYAYEMINSGTQLQRTIGELSVGFDGNTAAHNLGVLAGVPAAGISPSSSSFIPVSAPFASATWIYNTELTSGQSSVVLLFTSPNAPHFYNASVLGGGLGNQQLLPSPVPEPGTLMMLSGIALFALQSARPSRKGN